MINSIILPMFAHVMWTAILYALVTVLRAPKVWGIAAKSDGPSTLKTLEVKASANLSNQFEWPLFFHAICIILIANPSLINSTYIVLAWIFIAGRFLHSGVQILSNNIKLRGLVFTINYLAVLGMWFTLFINIVNASNHHV